MARHESAAAERTISTGALPLRPRDLTQLRQNGCYFGAAVAAPAIPAAESTLGSHPCVALSSAQVLPEWTTATSPSNDFSANGDNPLNFVSHSRGSLQFAIISCNPAIMWRSLSKANQLSAIVFDRRNKTSYRLAVQTPRATAVLEVHTKDLQAVRPDASR